MKEALLDLIEELEEDLLEEFEDGFEDRQEEEVYEIKKHTTQCIIERLKKLI